METKIYSEYKNKKKKNRKELKHLKHWPQKECELRAMILLEILRKFNLDRADCIEILIQRYKEILNEPENQTIAQKVATYILPACALISLFTPIFYSFSTENPRYIIFSLSLIGIMLIAALFFILLSVLKNFIIRRSKYQQILSDLYYLKMIYQTSLESDISTVR